MKSFRNILSEVAEPKAGDEKHFKDKHITVKNKHPVAGDNAFTGGTKKAPKRIADHDVGEDAEVYEGLDPVNKKAAMGKFKHRADKDIDNDGDVDSSDKYLHARRNAITKAVHKEEVEELDEISRDTARSYIRKASADNAERKKEVMKPFPMKDMGKNVEMHKKFKKREAGIEMAGKKAYGIGGKAKVSATESVEQVDEVLKPTTDMGTWIKDFQKSDAPQFKGKSQEKRRQMAIAAKYGAEREAGMREESELEEKLIGGQKKLDHNKNGKIDAHDFHLMRKKKMKEEAEQLDELSPNKLHAYIKGASADMKKHASMAGYDSRSRAYNNATKNAKRANKRLAGITSASGRLADKANMAENAWEEVPMMMRQLQFIMFAAEEIMEYLDTQVDPEEWFQNKLAHIHDQMQTLQAYAEGDMRMMSRMGGMYGEEVKLDEAGIKTPYGTTKTNKYGGSSDGKRIIPKRGTKAYDAWRAKNDEMHKKRVAMWKNEEVELDEVTDQERLSARKIQRDAQTARHGIARKPGESMVSYLNRAKKHKEKMQKEEVELDEDITKMSHGRLKWHMNSGVPHGSYTKDEMKAERDRRLKTDPMGYRSAKAGLNEVTQSAVKKTVTFTGSDGKAHTRNVPIKRIDRDEHGQEKIRESVELDEAFKVGMLKLNDGGSVILKKEDVDVLNSLFKSLSSTNRKKMESTAMKDKNGFNEILSFAREAM